MKIEEAKGISLLVEVSEGCEPFAVCLEKSKNSMIWNGHGFTKTILSNDFLNTHKSVINMLKICQKFGLLKSVYDETGIWK